MERTNPFHALPRKDYFSAEMWFALDVEPKYFAESDGLPPFVLFLVSPPKNYFIKPLRAMNGRREMSGVGVGEALSFSDSVSRASPPRREN